VGAAAGVCGVAEIGFAVRDGRTRLAHLHQRHPLRVLFPSAEAGEPPAAVLVTTSGGLVAGDRLEIQVALDGGAAAHVTASAAEKIYRSTGPTTVIDQGFRIAAGARLEFLPPETIVFDGARLRRTASVELGPSAGFLGGGILVFGRRAHGEAFTHGLLREVWEVRRDGVLVWGDALHLDGDIAATIADQACFDHAAACATLILAPPQRVAQDFVDGARIVCELAAAPGLRSGVTAVGRIAVARFLGPDPLALRRAYADLAGHWRRAAFGLPPRLPRPWNV
jgi:urease accessory protein